MRKKKTISEVMPYVAARLVLHRAAPDFAPKHFTKKANPTGLFPQLNSPKIALCTDNDYRYY
jgi:hypothetical protein